MSSDAEAKPLSLADMLKASRSETDEAFDSGETGLLRGLSLIFGFLKQNGWGEQPPPPLPELPAFVGDRDVLVVDQIGRTRTVTPEGYLLCSGVRIASTRTLAYRADEMEELEARGGVVFMDRPPDVLFSDETLASFEGKDVTIGHPDNLLDPNNWRDHSVGVVREPRRGEGMDSNYLVADLLIKDAKAIQALNDGLLEVSCGYDGDRVSTGPGRGQFTRIIGNHVALVEKGRAGPACAIGDEEMTEAVVANADKTVADERPAKEAGEAAVEKALAPVADAADQIAEIRKMIGDMATRMDKIESEQKSITDVAVKDESELTEQQAEEEVAQESEGEEAFDECKTMDAATVAEMRPIFQDAVAKAEILSPGIKLPAFNAKASKKACADAIDGLRKDSLQRAYADTARKDIVARVAGGNVNFDRMAADHMAVMFNAASELARVANNAPRMSVDNMNFPQGKMTAAKLQERITAFHKGARA